MPEESPSAVALLEVEMRDGTEMEWVSCQSVRVGEMEV